MKIIIDIPEEECNRWKTEGEMDAFAVRDAMKNGTPLPKGHGRLIDARKLFNSLFVFDGKVCPDTDCDNFPININVKSVKKAIRGAEAIIEANKAEREDKE